MLKSWAVPKGLADKLGVKRLAVRVQDRELEFGQFEGTIPEHEYGAGSVTIWDSCKYEVETWTDEGIALTLHGTRVSGPFNLAKFEHAGPGDWLLIKRSSA